MLNYTSGVLAVSGSRNRAAAAARSSRVQVSSSDISGAKYGPQIGISDVPSALPSEGSLVGFPMSVCSDQQNKRAGALSAVVSLRIHPTASSSK